MAQLDPDLHPYVPLIDAPPFGVSPDFLETVVKERVTVLGGYIGRETSVLEPRPLQFNPGNVSDISVSDVELECDTNGVVISMRRIIGKRGVGLAGVCAFYEPLGAGNGSLTWATVPPSGIQYDRDLHVLEATIDHELFHSVGVDHCEQTDCLMYPELPNEMLYRLAMLGRNALCLDCLGTIDRIAKDSGYFTRLRQKKVA